MNILRLVLLFCLFEGSSAVEENDKLGSKRGGAAGGRPKRSAHHKHKRNSHEAAATQPTAPLDADDVGMRFSKITFKGEPPSDAKLPMTPSDYPLDTTTAAWVRESLCPSIIVEADCFECDIPFTYLIEAAGGMPSHPSSNFSSDFWSDFGEVVDMQVKRLANDTVSDIIPLPVIWKDYDINDVAAAVHNEILGIFHLDLIQQLLREGAKIDTTIIPFTCKIEFLRGIVLLTYLNSWTVSVVGPLSFGVKYHVGKSRPEEAAWAIHNGNLSAPEDIELKISEFDLTAMVNFTAYPEGAPAHPSWPAMHSAASSASLWLTVVLNLTEAQVCEVKRLDYAIAYARTIAGVHYPSDNIAGLNIGQEIIALKLPEELHNKYGSDIEEVKAKIEQSRFDWRDFESSDCFRDGLTV